MSKTIESFGISLSERPWFECGIAVTAEHPTLRGEDITLLTLRGARGACANKLAANRRPNNDTLTQVNNLDVTGVVERLQTFTNEHSDEVVIPGYNKRLLRYAPELAALVMPEALLAKYELDERVQRAHDVLTGVPGARTIPVEYRQNAVML